MMRSPQSKRRSPVLRTAARRPDRGRRSRPVTCRQGGASRWRRRCWARCRGRCRARGRRAWRGPGAAGTWASPCTSLGGGGRGVEAFRCGRRWPLCRSARCPDRIASHRSSGGPGGRRGRGAAKPQTPAATTGNNGQSEHHSCCCRENHRCQTPAMPLTSPMDTFAHNAHRPHHLAKFAEVDLRFNTYGDQKATPDTPKTSAVAD